MDLLVTSLVDYCLLFFAYAFLGWCIEVTLKYLQYHRFINRGFLTGPWLPIYGSGAVLITFSLQNLASFERAIGTTFAVSFLLCGVLEYMASYVMEKRFHARWWDYSQKPMNLHGRIWIGNLVLFGLGGVLIIHVIDPVLFLLFGRMRFLTKEILAGCLSVVFVSDYVVSHFVLKLVKNSVEKSEADNTEAINREVQLTLHDKSIFYRRFADAYPEVIYRTEKVQKRMEAIKAETERLREEAELRLSEVNKQLAVNLEPTSMIKSSVIQKQEELIGLLYQEETASEEQRELKRQIEADMALLEKRKLHLPKLEQSFS